MGAEFLTFEIKCLGEGLAEEKDTLRWILFQKCWRDIVEEYLSDLIKWMEWKGRSVRFLVAIF